MSNALLNYHISDGQPMGEDANLYEIADYYGDLLFVLRPRNRNIHFTRLDPLDKQVNPNQEKER